MLYYYLILLYCITLLHCIYCYIVYVILLYIIVILLFYYFTSCNASIADFCHFGDDNCKNPTTDEVQRPGCSV